MHPRTQELLRHLDDNRAVLRAAVDGVSLPLRETRPAPDRWSVAEVLEHLVRIEEQLTRLLAMRLSEAQTAHPFEPELETSSVVDSIDNRAIMDRSRRITAGDRVLPRREMDSATAWVALETARQKFRALVAAQDGLAISAVTFPHPVLGVINVYQWFAFVGTHEARHADQIREIGAALAENGKRETGNEEAKTAG